MRAVELTDRVWARLATPIGELGLVAGEHGLTEIRWDAAGGGRGGALGREDPDHPLLRRAARQLTEYFDGTRKTFELDLEFHGTTFQKRVWNELLAIPYGETRSYGEIALRLGNPNATRAVGAANGRNPLPIVAPCHRVIGASGALTGFGGGLELKARLLDFERGALPLAFAAAAR
ncbi:MAG TPA: methylated-DNA--[protein]-cysteine S-methyltransferase [Candidatus Tumulicola sp.]|nr:methylated-DNA--[protein]-cysteine S-methyltransferase [Candidatus Tumulicola sp.]